MRIGLTSTIIAGVALTATLPAAQDAPQNSQATFRTGTRLVQVSVVVHDGRGRPVSGLTAGDFRVEEDGQEQRIALFSVEDGRSAGTSAAPAAGVFSNRIEGPAATGVTIVLFDRLNTRFEHLQQARGHIIEYLGQLRPEDRVGFTFWMVTASGCCTTSRVTPRRSFGRWIGRARRRPENWRPPTTD